MRILLLGGGRFLGRHLVAAAVERGHEVATLTRGQTLRGADDGAEAIVGDRDGDMSALAGREWDAVIDTSAYHPRQIESAAVFLTEVKRYVLVSTASVYRFVSPEHRGPSFYAEGVSETDAVHEPLTDRDVVLRPDTYGPLKVACENVVTSRFEHPSIIRSGPLIGPFDPTDSFPYWIRRVAEGGDILAPGYADRRVQLLDARDLASWLVSLAESELSGTFNALGPGAPLSMRDLLHTCRDVAGSSADFTWVSDDYLLGEGVTPWTELPLWVPREEADMMIVSYAKAIRHGLKHRPIHDTIADTFAEAKVNWHDYDARFQGKRTLTREREKDLLSRWSQSTRGH